MAGSRDDDRCFVGYLYAAVSILEPHIATIAGIVGLLAILSASSGVGRNKRQVMRMRHSLVVSADIAYVIVAVFMLSSVLFAVTAFAFMPMLVFVLTPIARQVVAQRITVGRAAAFTSAGLRLGTSRFRPIMVKRCARHFKCFGCAYRAAGAGLIVNIVVRAVCGGFFVLLLCILFRKAVCLKYGFHGHIAGRHDKRIVGYFGIAAYDLPLLEVIAVIGRCGKLYRRACRCRRSAYCCGAVVIRNDIHIVLLCSRRKFKFRVCIIIHMGVGGIGEKVIRIVLTVLAGEYHGIILTFSSNADGCAAAHGSAYAQLFAGRQIHVVCIAGSGVALYNGIAAYFKLPIVAGVDVYSAADICGILFDRTAGEIADRTAAVNIHRAAVAGSCISADNAAGHIQYGWFAVKVDSAAINGGVSTDSAS